MDYDNIVQSIKDKPSELWTPFDTIATRALFWVDAAATYNRLIQLGEAIHAGDKPIITHDDQHLIDKLQKDIVIMPMSSDERFWIATLWAYCYNEQLISMSDLAKWLTVDKNRPSHQYPKFSLDGAPSVLTNAHRTKATNWVRYNGIYVYIDPTQANPTYANKVLTYDVQMQLANSKSHLRQPHPLRGCNRGARTITGLNRHRR